MKKYEVWNVETNHKRDTMPVVIIADTANAVVAVPLSTDADEERLPTHALLFVDGLSVVAIARCEQAMVFDKSLLSKRIGEVSEELDRSALMRILNARLAKAA